LNELRKVKTLQLVFSVDGIGDQFEYARRLAKWDIFLSNISKWDDFLNEYGHPRPWINAVVSVHTILWIPAVLEWAHAKNYDVQHRFLSYPKYLNIHCFPTDIKDKIVDNLDQKRNDITTKVIDEIIAWLLKEDSSSLFSTTQKICMESENFTGLNYAKMFPEENSILLLSK